MTLLTVEDTRTMNSEEVKAEYTNSLADLTFNSKPLINMLTMLAEENSAHARVIVAAIEEHLTKVQTDVKLPILYLIDCIAKNIGSTYTELFSQNIVMTFCSVFKVVDEKTRSEMFKLRQTWNNVFPQKKLYAIDVQIHMLDPAWPVTAPPPSNSIYFNPKFLKSSPTTTSTTTTLSKKLTSDLSDLPMDSETLTMQQKLIQKQQELVELQQKKLELELLQKQVKLQNQKKTQGIGGTNILLKPEVAKHLMSSISTTSTTTTSSSTTTTTTKHKPLGIANAASSKISSSGTGTRITPVNSALVAAAASRPAIRDPRLLRQQQQQQQQKSSTTNSNLGSKSADSSNKVVTNKVSVRDNNSRNEPRLVNSSNKNKDNILSPNTSIPPTTTSPTSSSSSLSSLSSSTIATTVKSKTISPKTSSKPDQKFINSNSSKRNKSDSDNKNTKIVDLVSSPTKNKQNDKSPIKSHKKSINTNDNKKLYNKESNKRDIRDSKHTTSSKDPQTSFKGVKGSTKNRNYIRRNRSPSPPSPEPQQQIQDIDLRLGGPPEKQARIQDHDDNVKTKDVDLRQLPGPISKKRPSTETEPIQANKKSKSGGVFDVLFGNEDTDLRKLPGVGVGAVPVVTAAVERPPTPPPPPIISDTKEDSPKKSNNLDAIRAKLANATNRDKVLARSFRKKPSIAEDEDLRNNQKFIVSPAEFNGIKSGDMTEEQKTQLMNKIIAQMEHHKLLEAQMKDNEENMGNILLQQISDEEVETSSEELRTAGDRDDRYYNKYQGNNRDIRRGGGGGVVGGQFWRGPKRRPHWEGPRSRGGTIVGTNVVSGTIAGSGGASNWHPTGWRPMGANFRTDENRKSPEVPNDLVVDSVNQDDIKTISIDGVPRDIRYYDETAIVFMSWDDPREISFQDGSRRVMFDDKDIYLLHFNHGYEELNIGGELHNVRLGAPSREIFIDSKPYECYFGGPGITIDLNGRMTSVKLDGPPPQVKIGQVKRVDLVGGKVNLIIDAKILVPVFLDAKIQKFVIDGETHTLKFVDALKTVLINDVPFKVEFGGLPKPITVHDKKHFIRFSVLPRGIKPGYSNIKDMEGVAALSLSPIHDDTSQDMPIFDTNEAFMVIKKRSKIDDDIDRNNSNSPHFFQNFVQQNNLDVLSSVLTSNTPNKNTNTNSGYKVENIENNTSSTEPPPINPLSLLPPSININELFQKLVATGIVATTDTPTTSTITASTPFSQSQPQLGQSQLPSQPQQQHQEQEEQRQQSPPKVEPSKKKNFEILKLKLVTFDKLETLKIRQGALYEALYSGMQCSSCGMRFPPEQSIQYSQHLDWHFRQNRKGKKNIRVAASRRWYYSLSDWKNYEEIEDLEEREKNYFDQQQSQTEGPDENEEEIEIPSVPADSEIQDPRCEVCQDRLDQYFNEEKEEWHLRNAIRVDGKTYHPVCYEDYHASLQIEKKEEIEPEQSQTTIEKEGTEQVIPGLEIVLDDDDEEVVEKVEDDDEVIIAESDESKEKQETLEENHKKENEEEDDDDVIINEVIPEKIVVNDDDEYEDVHKMSPLPVKTEQIDDGFIDIEEGLATLKGGIKIKSEPIDPDELTDQMLLDEEVVEPDETAPATTHISSIDGNTEIGLTAAPTMNPISIGGKIKINISKPLPVITKETNSTKDSSNNSENGGVSASTSLMEPPIDPTQPLPPGEEPVQLNIKPGLRGIELKNLPIVRKGSELTGMCSIM